MKIAVVGTGYVGLVSGACFAEMGAEVTCVDVDKDKIEALSKGIIPIYEPGLDELVRRNVAAGRLRFATSLADALPQANIVFCAVGTPALSDGNADLSQVDAVARDFAHFIDRYTLLAIKSTVPVGTSERVRAIIKEELAARSKDVPFELASNPEFLKEGAAIKDFMSPDRVVIGVESPRGRQLMEQLYRPFLLNNFRVIFMDLPSAEMSKYASNAMLATRISFMNEIAALCDAVGADVAHVRAAMGSDARIGGKFLYPGCGYGGSCFPKDVQALIRTGQSHGIDMKVATAVEQVNEQQKKVVFHKLLNLFNGELENRRIALWGLAFKPETDDMRCAPSLEVIKLLAQAGAHITVFDPVAMDEARRRLGNTVTYASDMYSALDNADALAVLTEWKQFRLPDWNTVASRMSGNIIVDGRNIYNAPDLQPYGLHLTGIGRNA